MKVRFSEQAIADLRDIRQWSENHWGDRQAEKFANGLLASIERLIEHPNLGRRRSAFGEGLRSISYRGYAIFYIVTSEGPAIVGVLHERRNLAALSLSDRLRDV